MATYIDKNGNDVTAEKTAAKEARIAGNETARFTRMLFAINAADMPGNTVHEIGAAFYDNKYSVMQAEMGAKQHKQSFLSKIGLGKK